LIFGAHSPCPPNTRSPAIFFACSS
jgi:hypothetical protein